MKLYALLLLSLRSVGRNVRRSVLTATAMGLGLALLIFSRAIAEGGHEQWINSAVRLGTGHVAIQAPEYLETGRLEHRLDSTRVRRVVDALQDPAVASRISTWAPHLTVSGLASSAASALPVRIEGVDPAREQIFSTLPDQLQEGRYLKPDDRLHAFIGSELARRLEIQVGDRFVLTAQAASGEVEGQMMRVAGIFHTGIQEMDEGLVHVPLETMRRWLGVPGAVTTVAVLLESTRQTDAMVKRLSAALDGNDGIRVLGWRQASPELDSAVRIDDYGDYLFHAILFAIIALAILNAVMMSVLGRRREFGILQALGLTGGETGLVVLGEGLFLTAASGLVGMVLGFAFTWGFFRHGLDFSSFMDGMTASGGIIDPVIVPIFRFDQVVLSVVSIAVIGALASLYPAYRASKLDVAEAMKFEQ
ncbi:MAG: FtsX-like permease family protein [Gemmatimonadota bacterium]|jgi:ABC-type lipoprotein release transport system permease subunit